MAEQTEPLNSEESARAWIFRENQLDPDSFASAMLQLYRGEMSRATTWRTRLDTTTNWAVITVAASLTFVFGSPQNPHFVLLLVLLLVFTFLYIEARRYRYYAIWSYRVRLMETDFFAQMLTPPFRPSPDWANHMSKALIQPSFSIPQWEALGRRFYRTYVWLITLQLISWGVKLAVHPTPTPDWITIVERASIGYIPGDWIVATVGLMYGAITILAVGANIPNAWRKALPRPLRWLARLLRRTTGPSKQRPRPQEQLTTIITSNGQAIAERIIEELGRGVTALKGAGMYTGEARDVLLCATTKVQVPHLEKIIQQLDPHAFVVVSQAAKVRGGRFDSFDVPD